MSNSNENKNLDKTNINWYITTYDKTPSIPCSIRIFVKYFLHF